MTDTEMGTCTLVRHADGTVGCVHADPRVLITAELVKQATADGIVVDGIVRITERFNYRLVERTVSGNWIAERLYTA